MQEWFDPTPYMKPELPIVEPRFYRPADDLHARAVQYFTDCERSNTVVGFVERDEPRSSKKGS